MGKLYGTWIKNNLKVKQYPTQKTWSKEKNICKCISTGYPLEIEKNQTVDCLYVIFFSFSILLVADHVY